MTSRSQAREVGVCRIRLTCEARFARSVPALAAASSMSSGGRSVRKKDSWLASSESLR